MAEIMTFISLCGGGGGAHNHVALGCDNGNFPFVPNTDCSCMNNNDEPPPLNFPLGNEIEDSMIDLDLAPF